MSSQTKENDNSSSLPQSQYSDKEANFDDYQQERQQTDQLNTNSSLLPQSQCLHKEETSSNSSREGQQIDQLNTSSSSSLPLGQQLDKEEIYNYHERDYQQKNQLGKLKTSNSSLRQSCHPDKKGISNACQVEGIKNDQLETPSFPSDQWVLLGSSLSASEKVFLQDFASWTDATVTKEWDNNVTHVIVGKNAGSTWSRSYEILMAILSGKWVVQVEWIFDCLEELLPGPEVSYEVTFSNGSRTIDGPKKGRIRATEGAPKLFSGLHFFLSVYMNPDDRQRMQDLIGAAGGLILEGSNLNMLHENLDDSSVKPYFIHDGSTQREFAPSSLLDVHHREMDEVTENTAAGAQVISLFRVLEAIAAYDAQILNHSDRLTPDAPHTRQHSIKEEISNDRERDDQQTDQLYTPNSSSLPQGHHPGRGMSNAYQREKIETDQPATSSCPWDQLVLLGLSLSASEKDSLQQFASWTNATVTKEWADNVTHVIVGKNSGSSWSRSYEVLMATLFGKWVVQVEWIVDCLELRPGPEASYEVTLFSNDSRRTIDGLNKGRTRTTKGASKLFSGLCFCLSAYMNPDNRHHMCDLIAAAGGRVLHSRHEDSWASKPYFVYDGGAPVEFTASLLQMEVEEAKEHAAAGAQVISHLRVLDAVAAFDTEVLNQKGLSHPV
uniref:BRCT domain-containing protein n=1 Tax=Arundo donax TaxID=35708 RepID=A0A0A8YFP1_ARUDO